MASRTRTMMTFMSSVGGLASPPPTIHTLACFSKPSTLTLATKRYMSMVNTDKDSPSKASTPEMALREDAETKAPTAIASEKKSSTQQAKELVVKYGPAYIATSAMSSVLSIGMWYVLVRSGVDVASVLQKVGEYLSTTPVGRPEIFDRISPNMGTFALAYVAHKATSPLRFPIVVAAVPYVAKVVKIGKKDKQE